mgnify:CR=1 FL=1
MTSPTGRGRAPAKCILLGEHFVVHGARALAIPVDGVTTQTTVEAAESLAVHLAETLSGGARDQALQVVHTAIERLGLTGVGLRIEVQSSIPAGFGLGSSAALAVSLVRGLADFQGLRLTPDEVRVHAHALESLVHGAPSGLDDTVVSFASPVVFRRGVEAAPLQAGAPFRFVLASVGYAGSTFEAVAGVGRRRQENPDWFEGLLGRVEANGEAGISAFRAGDGEGLGLAMSAAHGFLQEVGVSTDGLDRLVDVAKGAGALGAKLTGAGCGGFMVALVPSGHDARARAALRDAGALHVLDATVT